ncbi:hypothetical protein QR680_015568 [Steinernema hermaphroditum]|uniref:Uncharacterized protein n=1 Tax=Steinernema hermaphroditum TaxID=289476 RepID=A0AA39H885_9BILA|nr:hypothetical protein QR680_015568 [Steinernema hermaphroditum]
MCNILRVTKVVACVILIMCILNMQLQRSSHLGLTIELSMLFANGVIFLLAIALAFRTYDCTPSIPLAIVCVGLGVTLIMTVVLVSTTSSGKNKNVDYSQYSNRSKQQLLQ